MATLTTGAAGWPTAREERFREREFYRYYAPLHASSPAGKLQHVDLYNEEAAASHKPRSSHVAALTAFCQLAAIRLQTKRALLFFFDRDNAYVLAEATRSLSLEDDNEHDALDGLWLGATIIPRGLAVCEHTVNIPALNKGSNQSHSNAGIIHIVNDLAQDTRFCDRPYVKDGPMARFYAGVPLTTPSGHRIGALCVLDDKPRDGLNDKQIRFLTNLSNTVMDHMDAVRSRAESSRGSHILSGMATFLTNPIESGAPTVETSVPVDSNNFPSPAPMPGGSDVKDRSIASSANAATIPIRPKMPPRTSGSSFAQKVSKTFSAAASLIRTASEADGVAFVDADDQKTTTAVPEAARQQRSTASPSASDYASTSETDFHADQNDAGAAGHDVSCSVLGQACLPPAINLELLTLRFLSTLLKRYPAGKIWYFDNQPGSASESSSSHGTARSSKREVGHNRVRATLRKIFPGAKAVGMVSTYNYLKDQVYAAGFIWTFSSVRILSFEADLNILRAFGDVIMGHIYRLGVQNEELVRSDFVSSISHELRSPIHGILGSVDLLREAQALDWPIVEQIEKCSINLLDVIEHLLEYSRITRRAGGINKRRQRHVSLSRTVLSNNAGKEHVQDVVKLTEDVADMIYYSHCCSMGVSQHGQVAFILNVNPSKTCEAKVNMGAFKRILANLISNALKYTSNGHVMVSIDTVYRPLGPTVLVKIVDTGCGMSADFIRHHLFRAFSQEKIHLAGGTGLGLSIVAQLVKDIGGQLDIQSARDTGTAVTITMPLNVEPTSVAQTSVAGLTAQLRQADGRTAARALHVTAVLNTCARLGVLTHTTDCDITLVFEDDLPQILSAEHSTIRCLVLLCTSFTSAVALRQSGLSALLACPVEYVAQPYGPEQFIRALSSVERSRLTCSDGVTPYTTPTTDLPGPLHRRPSMPTDPQAPLVQYVNAYVEVVRRHLEARPNIQTDSAATRHTVTEELPLGTPSSVSSIESGTPASEMWSVYDTSPEADAGSDNLCSPILLLVDDNDINLRLLTAFANKKKYRRFTAMNGREAVQAYEDIIRPHLDNVPGAAFGYLSKRIVVLMDINMPVMNGYEATQAIRAMEQKHGVPPASIVAVTALGSPEAKELATSAGFDQFLTKPVRLAGLESLLRSL